MIGVEDDDVVLTHPAAADAVEVGGANVRVGGQILELEVYAAAHERRQRKLLHVVPVVAVMIRALDVRAQMAGEIHDGVKVRNRAARVEAVHMAAAGLGLRIERLGQIDHAQGTQLIYAHVNHS